MWTKNVWQKSIVCSHCMSDYSWPTSSLISAVPRKHTGSKQASYQSRQRYSTFTSLPFQDDCTCANINLHLWIPHLWNHSCPTKQFSTVLGRLSHWTIYFMLLDQGIYCRSFCWRWVWFLFLLCYCYSFLFIFSFLCSGRQSSLWHSMGWILKSSVPAFLFLEPSGQGLPHYWCNNQREGLLHSRHFLCGQLWLVWGVSCWLVCWRKLTAWQISCTACFLVYLRAFFCMHVWLFAMPYLFLLHRTLKHCLWGLRHFVYFLCEMGLTVCGNVNMGVSCRQVY